LLRPFSFRVLERPHDPGTLNMRRRGRYGSPSANHDWDVHEDKPATPDDPHRRLDFMVSVRARKMKEQGTKWFDELKAYTAECRKHRPLTLRDDLSVCEEMQCRIIGGSLIGWLQEYGPRLLQERAVLSDFEGWEKDPFVVFTSEQPGLVAANEILEETPPTITCLYSDEFAEWTKTHPDEGYCWHIHTWSFFMAPDADEIKAAARYPLVEGETYWLHKEGTVCGPLFGRGGDHLWKWNGEEPKLLEECFNQWVS